MIDTSSRYYGNDILTLHVTDSDGIHRKVQYICRRIIPQYDDETVIMEHFVEQNERLDNITARYLGDPRQFWRICDANKTMHPDELTASIGATIRITLPRP